MRLIQIAFMWLLGGLGAVLTLMMAMFIVMGVDYVPERVYTMLFIGILCLFFCFRINRSIKNKENEELAAIGNERLAEQKKIQKTIFEGVQGAANILSLGVLSDGSVSKKEVENALDELEGLYFLFTSDNEDGSAELYWDDDWKPYLKLAKDLALDHLKDFEKNVKSVKDADIPEFISSVNGNKLIKKSARAILASHEFKERETDPAYWTLNALAKIIGTDFDFQKAEQSFFKTVASELKISNSDSDAIIFDLLQENRDIQSVEIEKIPTVTKKITKFIFEEFDDVKIIAEMSEGELRDRVPGLSKASANAIIKKLRSFYESDK